MQQFSEVEYKYNHQKSIKRQQDPCLSLQLFTFLTALNCMYYIALFVSECFVLEVDQFLSQKWI